MGRKLKRFAVATGVMVPFVVGRSKRKDQATAAKGYHDTAFWDFYDRLATAVDRKWGWDKLPTPLAILVLIWVRDVLRRENLFDTTSQPAVNTPPVEPYDERVVTSRTSDGTYNDLEQPPMGMAGSRFGRNVPIDATFPEQGPDLHAEPAGGQPGGHDPKRVHPGHRGQRHRRQLAPVHDPRLVQPWEEPDREPDRDPLGGRRPVAPEPHEDHAHPPRPHAPARPSDLPPTYVNTETHWWDLSSHLREQYDVPRHGAVLRRRQAARHAGRAHLLPHRPRGRPALVPGFWLGLAMLQTLFTREHNAICDHLKARYPALSDDELFEKARLINAALVAKIHTVEWTPAVISHPTTVLALRTNWWGLAGERVQKLFGRISKSEVISGIPGSRAQHYDVPYALTEEFVAVYRMHPLLPDDYPLRSLDDDSVLEQTTLRSLSGRGAVEALERRSMSDLFYSFGRLHPGVVCLHNFPRFLQEFVRPDGKVLDLAALDIVRSRESGVPRYNEFRRLLHLEPAKDFYSLTDNAQWAGELSRIYGGDIEKLDLTPGMYAERLPRGFAFSDTAFRIFVLMASHRLNSDRFFTDDYTPAVYTKAGLDWIDDNTMVTVLLRHYPELKAALRSVENGFHPWVNVAA